MEYLEIKPMSGIHADTVWCVKPWKGSAHLCDVTVHFLLFLSLSRSVVHLIT